VGTNVADLLATAARAEPGRIALSEAATGRNVTWSVLDDLADRVAHGLSSAGMVAGYRVMIAATNRIEFVATYFGVLRARMVAVPINPRSATGEIVRMLVDSGARMVVADPSTIGTVRAAVVGVREALAASGDEAATPPRVVGITTPEEDDGGNIKTQEHTTELQ
jgi:long-chain acyl-CoA synthetase